MRAISKLNFAFDGVGVQTHTFCSHLVMITKVCKNAYLRVFA